jgi:hypothetical protein
MKKICIFGVLIIMIISCLFAKEKGAPAATITEIEGMVEIQRAHGWERLAPLLPLFAGDSIRVSRPGKAVLLYLGGSPESVTETDSPYTIKKMSLGKSKGEKAAQKLAGLFKGLFGQEMGKKVNLVVRGTIDAVKIVQPDDTAILFPEKAIVLQWRGQQPPYTVSVFQGEIEKENKCVFKIGTNDTSLEVPVETFKENAPYSWIVSTPSEQWDGRFTLKSKAETGFLLQELAEILDEIPEIYPLTRAVVQGQFFIDHGLFYDAYQLINKSLAAFPESEALQRLQARFSSD